MAVRDEREEKRHRRHKDGNVASLVLSRCHQLPGRIATEKDTRDSIDGRERKKQKLNS